MSESEQTASHPRVWTRREVVGGLAAVLAAGCKSDSTNDNDKIPARSLFDLKKGRDPDTSQETGEVFRYTGQDGKPVDVDKLLQDIKGNDVTLTFGFKTCTAYCPFINGVLGALDEKAPGRFKHIIIATEPDNDNLNQATRDEFKQTVQEMIKAYKKDKTAAPDNLIILYPPDRKTSVDIQRSFVNLIGSANGHTPNIDIFDKTGQRVTKAVPQNILPITADLDEKKSQAQKFADGVLAQIDNPVSKGR